MYSKAKPILVNLEYYFTRIKLKKENVGNVNLVELRNKNVKFAKQENL